MNYTFITHLNESTSPLKKISFTAELFDAPQVKATASSYDEAIKKVLIKTNEHFDFISSQGLEIPQPSAPSTVAFANRNKNVFIHTVEIDISRYLEKTEKINVTMPISTIKKVDDFLKDKVHNPNLFSSRSDYITKACQKFLPYADHMVSIFNNSEVETTFRYSKDNPAQNCMNLIEYLKHPFCSEVTFFATSRTSTNEFSREDGPETNLPLMGAIATVNLPGLREFYVLFDGQFLTAQRKSCYYEVKEVLDIAIQSDKASYIQLPVPFTSQLEPSDAVKLLSQFPRLKLNEAYRHLFFQLLSDLSESDYLKS